MSPSAFSTESQWLAQLAAMRQAIAELKLDQRDGSSLPYGHDIVVDEDETSDSSSRNGIWDVFSEPEEEEDSDLIDGVDELDATSEALSDRPTDWLTKKCLTLAARNGSFSADELRDRVSALLTSDIQGTRGVMYANTTKA